MYLPPVLVSYVSLRAFLKECPSGGFRDWALDSGAYSVLNSGATVDLSKYTKDCSALLAGPRPPATVFALDVIGDPEATARNAEAMVKNGVQAIPTFHYGSSWGYLTDLTGRYDRVALSGLVARVKNQRGDLNWSAKLRWLEQCFVRVWPKWIHGFGCSDRRLLLKLPFASVDSTSWFFMTSRYGACQMIGENGRSLLPRKADNPAGFAAAVRTRVE